MRNYIICYDVTDNKRLRRLYNKMRGHGDRMQYSLFFCQLSKMQVEILIGEILSIINENEDRVMIVDMGDNQSTVEKSVSFLGVKGKIPERAAIII